MQAVIRRAAQSVRNAKALVITAGAGMGVDSGLMDFQNPEKFWEFYPALKEKNLSGADICTPEYFDKDPHLAWGFYGHTMKLFRDTIPHQGFNILRKWTSHMELGYFVCTTNVDGHFQKAGFADDRVFELQGNVHFMQATRGFQEIWSAPDEDISIDVSSLKAHDPLPRGPPGHPPDQQVLARPNMEMFGDELSFVATRLNAQEERMESWLEEIRNNNTVVIEIGSSTNHAELREKGKEIVARSGHNDSCLIRINLHQFAVSGNNDISVPMNALAALSEIDKVL